MSIKDFIGKEGSAKIVDAIKEAELNTSGEVRVHIESNCKGDPIDRAVYLFKYLKMYNTEARNGVLFYVAVKSKKIAVIGDDGINSVVPSDFWNSIICQMESDFKNGRQIDGLVTAIKSTGESLKKYFPYKSNDVNEQPDEISFGD